VNVSEDSQFIRGSHLPLGRSQPASRLFSTTSLVSSTR
jgi:hypothetical protein